MIVRERCTERCLDLSVLGFFHRHNKRPLPEAFREVSLVCHRGAHQQWPENSLSAFRAAAAHGYGIELDVQCFKDGQVIVVHDRTFERMVGAPAVAAQLTLDELRPLRLRHKNKHTNERIPTLGEVLQSFGGGVIVEIKEYGPELYEWAEAVVTAFKRFSDVYDRVIVQSFNPHVLRYVRELDPRLYRCQLFGAARQANVPRYASFLRRHLAINPISQPDAIAGRLALLSKPRVERYRDRYGYSVLGWTAQSPEDLQLASSLGLDIVISDYVPRHSNGLVMRNERN